MKKTPTPFDVVLARFRAKCRFDPRTGCVLWIGGTSAGRGHTARYGVLKVDGFRWYAHRWSARYIHGQNIDDKQVDHCCPHGPETLCVQHVNAVPPSVNRELQWIRVQVGLERPPPVGEVADDELPFFLPPSWLTE